MEWALEGLQVFQESRVKWETQEEQQLEHQALPAELVYQVCQEHQGWLVYHVCRIFTSIFALDSE